MPTRPVQGPEQETERHPNDLKGVLRGSPISRSASALMEVTAASDGTEIGESGVHAKN